VDNLGVVAEGADVISQFQTSGGLGAVGAGVDNLSIDARDGLGRLEVLLVCQTNDVGEFHPVFLALVGVPRVIGSDTNFYKAQFASLGLDFLGNILARRLGGRLLLSSQAGGHNQGLVQLIVFLADFPHFGVLVPQGVGPVAGSPLGDVHGLQRVLPSVPVNFALVRGYAGHRL
jgi:hypothetical protein